MPPSVPQKPSSCARDHPPPSEAGSRTVSSSFMPDRAFNSLGQQERGQQAGHEQSRPRRPADPTAPAAPEGGAEKADRRKRKKSGEDTRNEQPGRTVATAGSLTSQDRKSSRIKDRNARRAPEGRHRALKVRTLTGKPGTKAVRSFVRLFSQAEPADATRARRGRAPYGRGPGNPEPYRYSTLPASGPFWPWRTVTRT